MSFGIGSFVTDYLGNVGQVYYANAQTQLFSVRIVPRSSEMTTYYMYLPGFPNTTTGFPYPEIDAENENLAIGDLYEYSPYSPYQEPRAQLHALVATNLPDEGPSLISAADVREALDAIIDNTYNLAEDEFNPGEYNEARSALPDDPENNLLGLYKDKEGTELVFRNIRGVGKVQVNYANPDSGGLYNVLEISVPDEVTFQEPLLYYPVLSGTITGEAQTLYTFNNLPNTVLIADNPTRYIHVFVNGIKVPDGCLTLDNLTLKINIQVGTQSISYPLDSQDKIEIQVYKIA